MGCVPKGPDKFVLKKNFIECVSGSGHVYKITHDSCSCKGFSFRKECRHYRQAKTKGLFDELEKVLFKFKIQSSLHIKKARLDAIKVWLDKQKILYKPQDVINIEKFLDVNTTKQDIWNYFF